MKILVPIDGSKYSDAAVAFIAARTTLIGAEPEILVLNVQVSIPARAARAVGMETVKAYYDEEAERTLKPSLEALRKAGLNAGSCHTVGHPGEQIAAVAEREKVDLIAMGSKGHGALRGLVLGSTIRNVLARTRKPVLVLRARSTPPAGDALRVGIAVDGSEYGLQAVRYVIKHRHLFGANARFTMLHVVPDFAGAVMPDMAGIAMPAFTEAEIKAMQDKAFDTATEAARKLLVEAGVKADEVCLAGNAGDELSGHAKKHLDVLVLGTHGLGAFTSAALGSVATRVAAHCETPLLLIRDV